MDSLSTSIAHVPQFEADLPQFAERAPWVGGDLQTLRNFLRPPAVDLGSYRSERLVLPLRDGSGDRLAAAVHWPTEARRFYPVVLLIHGLTGCENSVHIRVTAADLLRMGFPVLRFNLRGAGPSRALCSQHYHAGRSGDLADALAGLPVRIKQRGLVAIGFSLGGSVLLKYLGEAGNYAPLMASVTVSTPLDLLATARRLKAPRNVLYHRYFLRNCRHEFAADSCREQARLAQSARTLWEFDDTVTAPRGGYAGAADYYARTSAQNFLDDVRIPTLLLHAANDPIVPVESYRAHRWRNRRLTTVVQSKGGHVGFHDRSGGVWHDRASALFFRRVLSLS
jgi:predicted alpha/beta-fold hydrolase